MNNNLICVIKQYTVKSKTNLFKGNCGLFTVSTVDEAIQYKQGHPDTLEVELLKPFAKDMMVNDTTSPWSGLYVADIDVKKYFNNTDFTPEQKEAFLLKLDKVLIDNTPKCTYIIQRSSSNLGYHIYNYFTGEIINENYKLISMWFNSKLFEKIAEIAKTETWLQGLVDYQNRAVDSEKVFDLHATNISQCIRVSNQTIVYKSVDFKPLNCQEGFIQFLKDNYFEKQPKKITYSALGKDSVLPEQINPNGFIIDHFERFSFANALYSEFGEKYDFETLFEIGSKFINTTVNKAGKKSNYSGRINDFKADLETAFRNNKKASKTGMKLLKEAGLIKGFSSDSKFNLFKANEVINLDPNQYISDNIKPVINTITNNKVTEIYAGCGFGKTYCIGKLAKELKRPVIFLVPTTSIAFQNINELKNNEKVILKDLFGNDYEVPGKKWKIVYAGTREKLKDIDFKYNNVVCCYEAFNKFAFQHLDQLPDNALLVFDEAHMIFNKEFRVASFNVVNDFVLNNLKNFPDIKLLLLSGTPSYETVLWKPYIVNYKKPVEPKKVAIQWIPQVIQDRSYIKSLRSYIYKLVSYYNKKSDKYLYLYYSGTGETLETMFNDSDDLKENTFCFYKGCNKTVNKEINENKWKANCKHLICSSFIEAGYNLKFPDSGDIVILAETADEAVQALARIRNRENIDNVLITLIGKTVNYYNEGDYTGLDLDLMGNKYITETNSFIKDRNQFKENQKFLNLDINERKLDGIKANTENIGFLLMVNKIKKHNSQKAVLSFYLNNNGFIIDDSLSVDESILYYAEKSLAKGKKEEQFQFFDWFNYITENGDSNSDNYSCFHTATAKQRRAIGRKMINNLTRAGFDCLDDNYGEINLTSIIDLREFLSYKMLFDNECIEEFYNGFKGMPNKAFDQFNNIAEIIGYLDGYCPLIDVLFKKNGLHPIRIDVELDRNLDDKCIIWFIIKTLLKGITENKYNVYRLYNTLTKLINLNGEAKTRINHLLEPLYKKSITGYCKESYIEYYTGLDRTVIENNDFIMKTIIEIENNQFKADKSEIGALGGAIGGALSGGSNKKSYKCIEDFTYKVRLSTIEFNGIKDQIYTVNDLIAAGLSDKVARKILKGDHFIINS